MREWCKKTAFLLLTVVLFLTGCTGTSEKETPTDGTGYVYDAITEISKNSRTAFSEKGYYYLVNGILYFCDINSDTGIPVCSKMECSHNSSSCDAYAFDNLDYDPYNLSGVSVTCLGNMIWYHAGNIYMIKREESGDYLMQYDSDFTNEVRLLTLADKGAVLGMPSKNTENTALLYDGYIYYFSVKPVYAGDLVDYTTSVYCNRVKLEKNAAVETLGTFDMAIDYALWGASSCGEICAGNQMVYFVAGGIQRQLSETDPVQYRICSYNCNNNSFSTVLNKNADSPEDVFGENTGRVVNVAGDIVCADDENNLYIAADKRIVRISALGQTETVYSNAAAQKMSSLIWDGAYVYLYEKCIGSGNIVRIDKQGNVKEKYPVTVNAEFCEEHQIRGTLDIELIICGVDSQNVIIRTESNYVKGLECAKQIDFKAQAYVRTYAVGVISKNAFDDPNEQIKRIYTYQ